MTYHYVTGLAFTSDYKSVLLIQQNRPKWQARFLNGLGGKAEDGEVFRAAMVRKFEEESGLSTTPEQWRHFLTIVGPDYQLFFFMTSTDEVLHARTTTDEPLHLVSVEGIPRTQVVENLQWIIPLALDAYIRTPVEINSR